MPADKPALEAFRLMRDRGVSAVVLVRALTASDVATRGVLVLFAFSGLVCCVLSGGVWF